MKKTKINKSKLRAQLEIQSMVWPAVILLFIFSYLPMYGIQMAFQNYSIFNTGDVEWVGFKYFIEFFNDIYFTRVMKNTLMLNILGLFISFPMPIVLAILICELKNKHFKKIVQTASYLPHFLSWVIFGGIAIEMLSSTGLISYMAQTLGLSDVGINFMAKSELFYGIYITLSTIKGMGFSSILFIAAITGIDQEMFEAATIDGANRFQKTIYLTIPSILGTIVIMLIFRISDILNTGFEQFFVLQNDLNVSTSETIDTYVYKIGLEQSRFAYAAAIGVFKSVISVILLVSANFISKKITSKGLF